MSQLATLQSQFQAAILTGNQDILPSIIATPNLGACARFAIYEHAYQERLIEVLTSHYPQLHSLLGDDDFANLSTTYIKANPSTHYSVRWFGHDFAGHLAVTKKDMPYLAELAEFEWKLGLAFDSSEAPILALDTIANLPASSWGTMRFTPHPSLQRINCHWSVIPYWKSVQEQLSPLPFKEYAQTSPWIIWRQDLVNKFYSIAADEAVAIDALIAGLSFGSICETLYQWHDEEDIGMRAATLLKGWIQLGLLSNWFE